MAKEPFVFFPRPSRGTKKRKRARSVAAKSAPLAFTSRADPLCDAVGSINCNMVIVVSNNGTSGNGTGNVTVTTDGETPPCVVKSPSPPPPFFLRARVR